MGLVQTRVPTQQDLQRSDKGSNTTLVQLSNELQGHGGDCHHFPSSRFATCSLS